MKGKQQYQRVTANYEILQYKLVSFIAPSKVVDTFFRQYLKNGVTAPRSVHLQMKGAEVERQYLAHL